MAALRIQLVDDKNQRVAGVIRPLDAIRDSLSWIVDWLPKMYDLAGEPLFQDSHWRVPDIWEEATKSTSRAVFILEVDDRIQGYIVVKIRRHVGRDGEECAYVAFVASAPWNRKRRNFNREYKGVGKALLWVALVLGYKEHKRLCLELHSLPLAEPFYLKLGFRQTGYVSHEGLKEYRLEETAALPLVRDIVVSVAENGGQSK